MLQADEWPEPTEGLCVRVIDEERTSTHTFTYRSDGLLSVQAAVDAPELVKKAANADQALVNWDGLQALRRLMDRINPLAS